MSPRPSLVTVAEDRGDDPVRVIGTGTPTPRPVPQFYWTPVEPKATALVGDGSGTTHATPGTSTQVAPTQDGRIMAEVYHAGALGRLWVTLDAPAAIGKGKPVDPGGPPARFAFVEGPINVAGTVAGIPYSFVIL